MRTEKIEMSNEHLLAIPVFNEAKYVVRVIDEASRFVTDILVIDDGSTDQTPNLLNRHGTVSVITHPENRGYGKTLADAFDFAQRHGYDWLITMDCDEQHEPARIPEFIETTRQNDADIISGTRYPPGLAVEASVPPDRRRINLQITDILNRRLSLSITDAFCGFKAYRVSALRHFNITVPGYAMPMQLWVQATRAGLKISEIPVRLIYNDPDRHFGGLLDNPSVRLRHYLDVFEAELAADGAARAPAQAGCVPCR